MGKFMKPGRVVLVLAGRYAGKKAVIVKNYDDGSNDRPYGHALLAGVARYPLKITKGMGKKLVKKRSRIKTFCKVTNYNHMMPTRLALFRVIWISMIFKTIRYSVDVPIDKNIVNKDAFKDAAHRRKARGEIKQKFQER